MYAIVNLQGSQRKVTESQVLTINRLDAKEGELHTFKDVLFLSKEKKVSVGSPYVKDSKVEGKILRHFRGEKVQVFKKKRRKGYKVKNGHRQYLTEIEITNIS